LFRILRRLAFALAHVIPRLRDRETIGLGKASQEHGADSQRISVDRRH